MRFASCHLSCLLQLCHSCAPPGVLGSASLAFPLCAPVYGHLLLCIRLVSSACGPSNPSSVSDSLLYWSLPCLSPKLLIYSSKPPKIRWIFLRLSLINTCNFVFNPLVSRQISKPYRSTAFTFDPQTLNLVLVVIRYKLIHFISKYFVRYLIS